MAKNRNRAPWNRLFTGGLQIAKAVSLTDLTVGNVNRHLKRRFTKGVSLTLVDCGD